MHLINSCFGHKFKSIPKYSQPVMKTFLTNFGAMMFVDAPPPILPSFDQVTKPTW